MIERRTTKSGRQRRGTGILSQAGIGIREERRGFVIHISLGRTKHFLVSIVEEVVDLGGGALTSRLVRKYYI
jgi:hypothetical protein